MVIKKTVKRKTVWRSLPIGADGEEVVHSAAAAGLATAPATTPTTRRQQRPPNNADNGCNIGVVYGNDVGGKCDADGDVIDAPPTSAAAPTHATVAPAAKHYAGSGRAVRHPLNAARTTYHDGRYKSNTSQIRNHSISSTSYAKSNRRTVAASSTTVNNTPSSGDSGATSNPSTESLGDLSASLHRWPASRNCVRSGVNTNYAPHRNDRFGVRNGLAASCGSGRTETGDARSGKLVANATRAHGGPISATSGYRRRHYNPRYYNGTTRSTFRVHRSEGATESEAAAEAELKTPSFNEDDYTRITTPRQDVLFKKGYLSRPKPYATQSTTADGPDNAAGMEDVIVLTPEEAIAAGLMHGYDPEHPYIGFYDASGMFYVNPYLNNTAAIDPYASQMMMMPYDAGAVGGMESNGELIATDEAPMQHLDFPEHSQTIVDDGVPCAECAAHTSLLVGTPEEQSSQNDDEPISTDSSQGCATSKGDEGDCEETTPDVTVDGSAIDAPISTMPHFFPQIFYPYVFGAPAPYAPSDEHFDGQSYTTVYDPAQGKCNRFRRRKRKPYRYQSSNGTTTTTDYSEDDENAEHRSNDIAGTEQSNYSDEPTDNNVLLHSNLQVNVCEFVPREMATNDDLAETAAAVLPLTPASTIVRNTSLNVHVPEFRPRKHLATPSPSQCLSNSNSKELTNGTAAADRSDSDDSGVSTIGAQRSAPNTPEPSSTAIFIDAVHFPSIGNGPDESTLCPNSPNAQTLEKATASFALSYAAIAQRPLETPPRITDTDASNSNDRNISKAKNTLTAQAKQSKKSGQKESVGARSASTSASVKSKSKVKSKRPNQMRVEEQAIITKTVHILPVVEEHHSKVVQPVESKKATVISFADLLKVDAGNATTPSKPEPILQNAEHSEMKLKKPTTTDSIETVVVTEIADIETTPTAPTQEVCHSWQTIRVNGKKRMVQHIESVDFWEEKEDDTKVSATPATNDLADKPVIVEVNETPLETNVDDSKTEEITDNPEAVKSKTKRTKVKKTPKKVGEKSGKVTKPIENRSEKVTVDVIDPSSSNVLDVSPCDLMTDAETVELNEYNFVTDPNAIFVNAIAPSVMFSSPRIDKFSMFGGVHNFDMSIKSPQANATLRHEEDIVMRVMRSINSVEAKAATIVDCTNGQKSDIQKDCTELGVQPLDRLPEKTDPCIDVKLLMREAPKSEVSVIGEPIKKEILTNGHAIKENGHVPCNKSVNADESNTHVACNNDMKNGPPISNGELIEAVSTNSPPPTIEISSISQNGNTNGNTIESKLDVAINVTNQLQIQPPPKDVVPRDIGATETTIMPAAPMNTATHGGPAVVATQSLCSSPVVQQQSDLSDDAASTLSSLDDRADDEPEYETEESSEADDRTVVGPLDEYIEDVFIDDTNNLLGCGEFYDAHRDYPLSDDRDIDELIKQAEQICTQSAENVVVARRDSDNNVVDDATTVQELAHFESELLSKTDDRNDSPRHSEDSGILDNHYDKATFANESTEELTDDAVPLTQSVSLTETVSRWLLQKQKEKSPEPLIRMPEDPVLSTYIEQSIQRYHISELLKSYVDDDEDDDDEEEIDGAGEEEDYYEDRADASAKVKPVETSKNWQSNPLPVSSAKCDDAGKRVAFQNPQTIINIPDEEGPDILEYWDVDPMLNTTMQQRKRNGDEAGQKRDNNCSSSPVNYAQLLSEVGVRTTIGFLMSQQQHVQSTEAPVQKPDNKKDTNCKIDPQAGEYLKRHQFGCALM